MSGIFIIDAMRRFLQAAFFLLFLRPFFILFIGLRVRGREHLPAKDPFILIANHSSHLDAASLLFLFPLSRLRRVRPVAAKDYFERNAAVSWLSRTFFNILPIARKDMTKEDNPVEEMRLALERGESLILFPEGTRGSGPDPAPFHSGIARLLDLAPGVPVVPAYLVNLGRSLPKGEFLPVPLFCEVRLGAPLHPAGTREEILSQLQAAVAALRDDR
jgi:1-acyl-sn-glycerol-3-phosphate acyltransferase